MSKNPDEDALRELGKKYLNKKGLKALEAFLAEKNLKAARIKLLGSIARSHDRGDTSDEEAMEDFDKLGISPEEAIAVMAAAGEYSYISRTKQ